MKGQKGRKVELFSFFNLAARWRVGGQRHTPTALLPGKWFGNHCIRRSLGGPRGQSGRVRKISPNPNSILGPSRQKRLPFLGLLINIHNALLYYIYYVCTSLHSAFFPVRKISTFFAMCTTEFHRNVAFTNIFFRKCHLTCHNSILHGQYQAVSAFLPVVEECQRHATVRKEWRHDIRGRCWPIAGERIVSSRIHCSTPTGAPHLRSTSLTRTISNSLRVKLSHIYRSLLTLSANHNCVFFTDRLHDIVFTDLAANRHVVLWYFVNSYWMLPDL